MKRIIIVDDDPAMQDAFCHILERAGYAVTVYANGNPILNNRFEMPDVIILDRQLSGADGLDICRELKQRSATKHIPIIMLSASPHIRSLAEMAGADDFLEKPFKLKDFLVMIRQYVPAD